MIKEWTADKEKLTRLAGSNGFRFTFERNSPKRGAQKGLSSLLSLQCTANVWLFMYKSTSDLVWYIVVRASPGSSLFLDHNFNLIFKFVKHVELHWFKWWSGTSMLASARSMAEIPVSAVPGYASIAK
jgi:hypothetical protein